MRTLQFPSVVQDEFEKALVKYKSFGSVDKHVEFQKMLDEYRDLYPEDAKILDEMSKRKSPKCKDNCKDKCKDKCDEESKEFKRHVSRVCIFHWDDGFKSRKGKNESDGKKFTLEVNRNLQNLQYRPSKVSKSQRLVKRRVVAYVWVDTSTESERSGYVFYGGSVYNPMSGFSKMDLELLLVMGSKPPSIPSYNGKGEKNTAVNRLKTRPVVFKTNATSHAEVRNQISKMLFKVGPKNPHRQGSSAETN